MGKEKGQAGLRTIRKMQEKVKEKKRKKIERSLQEEKRLNFVAFVLSKKFKYDKLMDAFKIEPEGIEVHGYMQRMFPDYEWLIENDVLDRACYLALQHYQPIVHNIIDNYDFENMYRSLVILPEKTFFKHYPNFEFDRLVIYSDEPLKKDLTWINNHGWETDEGYETTMSFAPCNFLNMGSPLPDLPILVLKDAIGKSKLFFQAKTTAEDLTKQKNEIIRKEIYKLRENEKNTEELIDELEIESKNYREMYLTLKHKMLSRVPFASEEEFENFEKREMEKRNPFNKINYKRIILGIVIMVVIILLIVGLGFLFIPQPVSVPSEIPEGAGIGINLFRGGI